MCTDMGNVQAEAKMGKDLSTGNLKSHLQHNHRAEFQAHALPSLLLLILGPSADPRAACLILIVLLSFKAAWLHDD